MALADYLVNDTRMEYANCGNLALLMRHAEEFWGWDLRRDHIYVWHTIPTHIRRFMRARK
jgi:hypothetical protein